MILGLAFASFGLALLVVAAVVIASVRQNARHLDSLGQEVHHMTDRLRTPAERAERRRRIEEIEHQKRVIHGFYDSGGC